MQMFLNKTTSTFKKQPTAILYERELQILTIYTTKYVYAFLNRLAPAYVVSIDLCHLWQYKVEVDFDLEESTIHRHTKPLYARA